MAKIRIHSGRELDTPPAYRESRSAANGATAKSGGKPPLYEELPLRAG
ncbi:MAG: hypothetical protein LAN59_13750 [Acidobacteriia bacterium]|nr:hypothetical protein [Terriglobia bacterium]